MTALKLDAKFIRTFVLSTLETLKVQCSFAAKAEKSFAKGNGKEVDIFIAGSIGLSSDGFNGTITVGFPKTTYLNIMSGMLGEQYEEMTKDLEDGAAELINIIFGGAKKAWNDNGYNISRALPSVVLGEKVKTLNSPKASVLVIPFASAGGPFQMEIVVESAVAAKKAG